MKQVQKEERKSQSSNQGANSLEACWCNEEELRTTVQSWAIRIGVQPPTVRLQALPKAWATIDVENVVMSVASEVLTIPRLLGEYVIVHELVHLLAPQAKHGRLFKLFLGCYLPDWQAREARLQTYVQKTVC